MHSVCLGLLYLQRCGRAHWRCLSGCSGRTHPSDTSGSAAAGSQELEALLSSEDVNEILRGRVYTSSLYTFHFTKINTRIYSVYGSIYWSKSLTVHASNASVFSHVMLTRALHWSVGNRRFADLWSVLRFAFYNSKIFTELRSVCRKWDYGSSLNGSPTDKWRRKRINKLNQSFLEMIYYDSNKEDICRVWLN